jgi:phenylpyruvate tautomerase PptA (4-oxalocrotonate tautomerase family)
MKTNLISKPISEITNDSSEVTRRAALVAASVAGVAVSGLEFAAAVAGSSNFGAPFVEMTFPVGVLSVEQKAAHIKRVTDVVSATVEFPSDSQRRLFVEILETPDGGFGVNGQVVLPRPRQ